MATAINQEKWGLMGDGQQQNAVPGTKKTQTKQYSSLAWYLW